jgi:GDP-L-fucose synthase
LEEQRTHAMNGIIMRMLKSKKSKDKSFQVWGSGTPVREWVYMPDVARFIKNIIDEKKLEDIPNPLNLGQQYGISIINTVKEIKDLLDYDVEIECDLSKPDGAPIKVLGDSEFREHFKDFKFTEYREGIINTINYYKSLI